MKSHQLRWTHTVTDWKSPLQTLPPSLTLELTTTGGDDDLRSLRLQLIQNTWVVQAVFGSNVARFSDVFTSLNPQTLADLQRMRHANRTMFECHYGGMLDGDMNTHVGINLCMARLEYTIRMRFICLHFAVGLLYYTHSRLSCPMMNTRDLCVWVAPSTARSMKAAVGVRVYCEEMFFLFV